MHARGTRAGVLPSTIVVAIAALAAILVGLAASSELGDPLIGTIAGGIVVPVIVALLQAAGVTGRG